MEYHLVQASNYFFPNPAHQSLGRRQKLIRMRLGPRFFIYGMNGSKTLLQMHTPINGLKSHAKITGIWQGMLPVYLHIDGFNACCRGILWYLSRGPSATYVGVNTPCVLQVRRYWTVEREATVDDAVWNREFGSFANSSRK